MRRSMVRRAALLALAAMACDKTAVQDIAGPEAGARIKFFNFGVNAPGVNFYAGPVKMTAITSATGTEATTGVASGGVGAGGLYSSIAPGAYTFEAKIAATVDKDLAIARANATLADGKAYSFYISGAYDAVAKTAEAFVVEDALPPTIEFDNSAVRFVHAMANTNPMILFARHTVTGTEVAVGAAVAYRSAGAFTVLPPGVYDLVTRYANSTTPVITRTGVSFNGGRVYTIGARGDITVTSTTAATRPQLDNTANR